MALATPHEEGHNPTPQGGALKLKRRVNRQRQRRSAEREAVKTEDSETESEASEDASEANECAEAPPVPATTEEAAQDILHLAAARGQADVARMLLANLGIATSSK